MKIAKNEYIAIFAVALAVVVVAVSVFVNFGNNSKTSEKLPDIKAVMDSMAITSTGMDYDKYLASNTVFKKSIEKIDLAQNVTIKDGESYSVSFEAPESFAANIALSYRIISHNNGDGKCSVYLNGKVPFREAEDITLHRQWLSDEVSVDERNNQYSVPITENKAYNTEILRDNSGFHTEPFIFYFNSGINNITISALNGDIELSNIRIFNDIDSKSYKELSAEYGDLETEKKTEPIIIQGELPYLRTNASIAEACDRTSPLTQPEFEGKQVWNTIGGTGWGSVGQSVTWKLQVKESGYYNISLRFMNNFTSGLSSYRRVLIDGEVPFSEMKTVKFPYSPKWQSMALADSSGQPYYFYLSEGEHTLSLEVTLGELAYPINVAKKSLTRLNEAYRKILMVTGASPDKYRDYQIEEKLPDVLQIFEEQRKVLRKLSDWLIINNSGESEGSAKIEELIRRLDDFIKYPESVPQYLSTFLSNLTGLSDWVQGNVSQPLTIDYLKFEMGDLELPEVKASFISNLVFNTRLFIKSFANDYGVIGNIYSGNKAVEVWLTLGRDQYQIIKEQIDSYFTLEKNIGVNLKLVSGGILEATVANIEPDVYLFADEAMPINFAARGALKNLKEYEDFNSITDRFAPETFVPYSYDGGVYAIPITQDFDVMFVRDDILKEIGLKVPETWDDIYNCLTTLQQNNMELAYPGSGTLSGLALILFQHQDNIYTDDGKRINFDNEIAIDAFDKWTKLYSEYSLQMSYSFVNRFRTGDMPIGIAPFSTYNTLEVSAPEISGLWNMYKVPGVLQEDGTIKHTSLSSSTSAMILKTTSCESEAWEFVKWFTSEEQQYRYATAIENRQGISGRFSTANINAFNRLSWSSATLKTLNAQRDTALSIEQVPGGYFTSRHINNIFRKIINQDANVRETVGEYTKIINEEITKKRKEFGLEVDS